MELATHRRDRTIYVNNITKTITEDDLFTLFQRAGPIEKVIFKNVDGTPQHALIVFRRLESVMFCLENVDYFVLKGQQLGIRTLRESQMPTMRARQAPQMPHSAGWEPSSKHHNHHNNQQQQHPLFNFDQDYVQQFRQHQHNPMDALDMQDTLNALSGLYASGNGFDLPPNSPRAWPTTPVEPHAPFLAPPPTPVNRSIRGARGLRLPPLQLPVVTNSRTQQIWVPADQHQPYHPEPFTAPPFSAPPLPRSRFIFPQNSPSPSSTPFDRFNGLYDSNDKFGAWPNFGPFTPPPDRFDDRYNKDNM